jgi:osmotically-inducible protein OsmY
MIRIADDPSKTRIADSLSATRDGDLQRRVVNYLLGHRMPALRRIEVEADNGTVVVRGQVRSFYQKQLCIHCARRVAGVVRLIDRVHVVEGP